MGYIALNLSANRTSAAAAVLKNACTDTVCSCHLPSTRMLDVADVSMATVPAGEAKPAQGLVGSRQGLPL